MCVSDASNLKKVSFTSCVKQKYNMIIHAYMYTNTYTCRTRFVDIPLRKNIKIKDAPIKQVGSYTADVKIYKDIAETITFEVVED